MSTFLETLQSRLAEAEKNLEQAQKRLTLAHAQSAEAVTEVEGWKKAVAAELRREQQASGVAPHPQPEPEANATSPDPNSELNKTQMVREILRQNPTGMTPAAIWGRMKNQIAHRPYLYSILKRLKDKDQVFIRRGKYFYRVSPKTEEGDEHSIVQ